MLNPKESCHFFAKTFLKRIGHKVNEFEKDSLGFKGKCLKCKRVVHLVRNTDTDTVYDFWENDIYHTVFAPQYSVVIGRYCKKQKWLNKSISVDLVDSFPLSLSNLKKYKIESISKENKISYYECLYKVYFSIPLSTKNITIEGNIDQELYCKKIKSFV